MERYEVRPFEVAIPDEQLDDLRARLGRTRWAHDVGNEDGAYGVPTRWLQDLVRYWLEEFDWREQERRINAFPQRLVEIDGVPIHFVHARGVGPAPKPLILTHGWPWTFWDWAEVIGPLSDPAAHGGDPRDAFDVVVPSLPGAGFSTPLTTTGLHGPRVAELWHALMTEALGYDRYGAGGGDFGSIITGEIGHRFSDALIGVWLTLPYLPGINLRALSADDFAPDEAWMWERVEQARPTIQSHRNVHQFEPQTIAHALVDSPAGTAGWILGRRQDWSDHDGDVFELFSRDFLCTTASIYWLNGSIASSLRIYSEHFRGSTPPPPLHDRERVIDAPTGFALFPKELLLLPRRWAERATNLTRWQVLPRGGHFAPSEQPQAVVDELRAFFADLD